MEGQGERFRLLREVKIVHGIGDGVPVFVPEREIDLLHDGLAVIPQVQEPSAAVFCVQRACLQRDAGLRLLRHTEPGGAWN